ncbi:hypothetical protein [Planctomycetes bacterium K23_9]|uniref:Uncharacterized protein n=1 Tax=Stieleria marina TaxID=1930275 RepID=A0A517NNX4_9BACT|nr:hypothetical protein K239x_07680 [Planctomycetes bacterium K23_9]
MNLDPPNLSPRSLNWLGKRLVLGAAVFDAVRVLDAVHRCVVHCAHPQFERDAPLGSGWQPGKWLRPLFCLLLLGIVWIGSAGSFATAETPSLESPAAESTGKDGVVFGIAGNYRIGYWTAVRIDATDPVDQGDITIETLDGDGVRVVFDLPSAESAQNLTSDYRYGYVVPGTEAAPILVRRGEEVVIKSRFPEIGSPARGPSAIPIDMPWVVCLGDPLSVDQLGANELLDRDAQIAVSIPSDVSELPDSSMGYHGVDIIMINSVGYSLLQQLQASQQQAIVDWINSGGKVFLTLGQSAPELSKAAPWLVDLLPIQRDMETVELSPSAIETFTSTQTPLTEFVGVRLPKNQGEVLLTGRTARRVSTPIAVDYIVGLGRVTVLAADLESETFAAWPERMDLIRGVTGDAFSIDKERISRNRITAFDDLAGQTRATLDQFPVKRQIGFSVLAMILLALIALVGPLDYFLINRVFGKPLLGWLTFPIVALGLSALLATWSLPRASSAINVSANSSSDEAAKPDRADSMLVQCNRIEIVDVDVAGQIGNGFAWSYLYSHSANQFDLTMRATQPLSSLAETMTQNYTAPFGTPGTTFGGIQIAGEDARLPAYHVAMADQGDRSQSSVQDLAIAPRSSKSLATQFRFTPSLVLSDGVKRRRGSELLEGKLTNPLSVDLLDAMLVYGNWVYLLPTRFRGGSTIDFIEDLRQKNFRWRLSRQEMLEKNSVKNESWLATDFKSPSRMAEMLMFHGAVGGSRYTGLKNGPLKQLDLSELLVGDRCMLVGRLRDPWLDVELKPVHRGDEPENIVRPTGQTLSMVRIVLPVQSARSR